MNVPNKAQIRREWSISTILIYLENTNESKASELLFDIPHLEALINDLRKEHKEIYATGSDREDNLFAAINDMRKWLKELTLSVAVG